MWRYYVEGKRTPWLIWYFSRKEKYSTNGFITLYYNGERGGII